MKKTLILLGVASLLAASPVLAATSAKAPVKPAASHSEMCMLHGKKVACKHHTMKKHATGIKVASKKK